MDWLHEHLKNDADVQREQICCSFLEMVVKPGALMIGPFEMAELKQEFEKLQNEGDIENPGIDPERYQSTLSEV